MKRKKLNNIQNRVTYMNLFIVISAVSTFLFFLFDILNWGKGYNEIILGPDHQFSDYFLHIIFASHGSEIYGTSYDACFPPLSYVMYYILWRIYPTYIGGGDGSLT